MKDKTNVIIITTAFVVFLAICFISFAFAKGVTTNNISSYESLLERKSFLPSLDEFDNSKNFEYYRFRKIVLFFEQNAYNLKVAYNNDEYVKEKLNLDKKYDFYEDEIVVEDYDDEDVGHKKANFRVGNYSFRTVVLPDEINVLYYPKEMLFIGTNDLEQKIVYLYYEDFERDLINTTLDEFVVEECNFK